MGNKILIQGAGYMSDNIINVFKSTILIIRIMTLVVLQFVFATLKAKLEVVVMDIGLFISLTISLVLLWSEYIVCIGCLIGVSIRQDKEQFDYLYKKYNTYFNEVYLKLDNGIRQLYSIDQIVNCKVNM